MTSAEQATSPVDRWSSPGHDRDCARAIHAQARHRFHPIDDVQVEHLLRIGYTAGRRAAMEDVAAALDAEPQVAPKGFITAVQRRRRRWFR